MGAAMMQVDEGDDVISTPGVRTDPAASLKALAAALHHARMEGGNEGDDASEESSRILRNGLAQFARSRGMLRGGAMAGKADKGRVAETRSRMDASYLALQNRRYEVSHLYREIERCGDYDSLYQEVPLIDEDTYIQSVQDAPSDDHERMVARLKHEVQERQRAQAELKALLASKTKVIKETEIRKASLEQLEKQLDDFVASAKAIQDKFSKM